MNLRPEAPTETMAVGLRACRRHFLFAALFSALLNLLFIVPMLYMLQVYDRVVPTRGGTTLLFLTLVLVFGLATLALLDAMRSRLLIRAGMRLDRFLSGLVLDTVLARRDRTLDTISRQAMREFDTLRQALTGSAILALFDAPWSPIYVLICFLIDPALGVLVLVGGVLLAFITVRSEHRTIQPLQDANQAAARAYASQEQVIAGSEVVRALGMRRALVRNHLAERKTMLNLQTSASFAASRYATASRFIRLALQSLALGLGALLAIHDRISGGAIFAASFLAGRALAPIDQLLASWRTVSSARGAYASLNQLLASREASFVLTSLPAPLGRIAAEEIVLLNAAGDGAILGGLSFAVGPGEVVAVVGPSGAGKSTLLRILSGGAHPTRGKVRIDGADARDWDQERLAPFIGYLPQDVSLFAGTIKQNIARFDDDANSGATDLKTVAAAKACFAHDMILRLPGGYDSPLGWGGRGMSAGQAQRVALARALYGEPAIILLDEPNSHLDAEGEVQLLETLAALKNRGAAVIIVAHRMGILAAVDKIMVMRDGRIEAFGERDEIAARLRGPTGNQRTDFQPPVAVGGAA